MTGEAIIEREERTLVQRIANCGRYCVDYVAQGTAGLINNAVRGFSQYAPRILSPNTLELNSTDQESVDQMSTPTKVYEAYNSVYETTFTPPLFNRDDAHKRFKGWINSLARENRGLFLDVCNLIEENSDPLDYLDNSSHYLVRMIETLISVTDKSYKDLPRAIQTFKKFKDPYKKSMCYAMDLYVDSPETILRLIDIATTFNLNEGRYFISKCLYRVTSKQEGIKMVNKEFGERIMEMGS